MYKTSTRENYRIGAYAPSLSPPPPASVCGEMPFWTGREPCHISRPASLSRSRKEGIRLGRRDRSCGSRSRTVRCEGRGVDRPPCPGASCAIERGTQFRDVFSTGLPTRNLRVFQLVRNTRDFRKSKEKSLVFHSYGTFEDSRHQRQIDAIFC